MKGCTGRRECLQQAREIVTRDRNIQYGEPEDKFRAIADMWTAYIDYSYRFDPEDVAMMMILLKVARGTNTADNFVDIAGYAACGYEVAGFGEELDELFDAPEEGEDE